MLYTTDMDFWQTPTSYAGGTAAAVVIGMILIKFCVDAFNVLKAPPEERHAGDVEAIKWVLGFVGLVVVISGGLFVYTKIELARDEALSNRLQVEQKERDAELHQEAADFWMTKRRQVENLAEKIRLMEEELEDPDTSQGRKAQLTFPITQSRDQLMEAGPRKQSPELDRRLQQMQTKIDAEKALIEQQEKSLDDLGQDIERSRQSVDRSSQDSIDRFNARISDYNSQAENLGMAIDRFNLKIDEHDAEVRRLGTPIR